MNKKLVLLFFIIVLASNLFSQTIQVQPVALSGINFPVKIVDLPDTLSTVNLLIANSGNQLQYNLSVSQNRIDTLIALQESGSYSLSVKEYQKIHTDIQVIPGILSILPPIISILLALIFRQVVISLIIGIFSGSLLVNSYDPFTGFLRLVDHYIINSLSEVSHIQIVVFTLLFGGVIGLISRSGGTRGIANVVTRLAKTRRSGMLATWLSGILIFFDDYANTLVVGNLMRPVTDKLKISREKLSFIVDATAAPVASIFIVSSWIGYEIGLIQDGLTSIGSAENAYTVFIQTLPYRFYPIVMLLFVFISAYMQRDFGPMLKAERRSLMDENLKNEDSKQSKDLTESSVMFGNEDKAKWYNGIVPILVIIVGTILGLYFTGIASLEEQGIRDYGLREIIGSSDSYKSLLWSGFGACVIVALMILAQRIMSLTEVVDAWFLGIRSMLLAVIILTLAWSIGAITQEIKTADYIISIISDSVNPRMLPVLVFLVCALTSFATGTSWGTMAIMMPIVIPLADTSSSLNNYGLEDQTIILHGVISSVLAGTVFGDHCSPISDTTILSSMASSCDHIEHVRTQLPYAILIGILGMLIGDIPTAYGVSPYVSLAVMVVAVVGILFVFGKTVNPEKRTH
ncbi:MAG: Na+/H+ antiporter NhaC family protein [Ignavibacteriales bacterium]|nr:MAG: Na+/H+ antiporter NhaC family protein [Ignavibacteriales bacterium]